MKKVIATVLLVFAGSVVASAQQVTVSQEYLDDSVRAFREVVALRSAVDAQKVAIAAVEAQAKAQDETIAAQKELLASKDREILLRDEKIDLLKKITCDKTSLFFGLIKKTQCH